MALDGDCFGRWGQDAGRAFGVQAGGPTVSRLIDRLAAAEPTALSVIRAARAEVREQVWQMAGACAPDAGGQVVADLHGVLALVHSKKQDTAATWRRTFRRHPLMGLVDHGPGGTGEAVAASLPSVNVGSNTAADHITTTQLALAQLSMTYRHGRDTLIRIDSVGGTHGFVAWLAKPGEAEAVLKVSVSARTGGGQAARKHSREPWSAEALTTEPWNPASKYDATAGPPPCLQREPQSAANRS